VTLRRDFALSRHNRQRWDFYAPNYADVFGGNPTAASTSGRGKDKKEEETDMSVVEGQPPPFNPTAEFFFTTLSGLPRSASG
jgi:hypothetical protein